MSRHEDRKRDRKKAGKKQGKKSVAECSGPVASRPAEDAEYDCRLGESSDYVQITILTGPFKGMSYLSDEDEAD